MGDHRCSFLIYVHEPGLLVDDGALGATFALFARSRRWARRGHTERLKRKELEGIEMSVVGEIRSR